MLRRMLETLNALHHKAQSRKHVGKENALTHRSSGLLSGKARQPNSCGSGVASRGAVAPQVLLKEKLWPMVNSKDRFVDVFRVYIVSLDQLGKACVGSGIMRGLGSAGSLGGCPGCEVQDVADAVPLATIQTFVPNLLKLGLRWSPGEEEPKTRAHDRPRNPTGFNKLQNFKRQGEPGVSMQSTAQAGRDASPRGARRHPEPCVVGDYQRGRPANGVSGLLCSQNVTRSSGVPDKLVCLGHCALRN